MEIDVTVKKNIQKGMLVDIIVEEGESKGGIARGYVAKILSHESQVAKGIKVALYDGKVGRVDRVPSKEDIRLENFKFYNRFFFAPKLFSVWDQHNRSFFIVLHKNQTTGVVEKTALLFDDRAKAESFLRGSPYSVKEYPIRELNLKKRIAKLFESIGVDFFRINGDRKLSYSRLVEWENYFHNMR